MTDNNNNVAPAQTQAEQKPVPETISASTKNQMIILWILSIFFGFIPAVIYYFVSKDDAEFHEECRKALNVQLVSLIGYIASLILCVVVIGLVGVVFFLVYYYGNIIVGLIAAAKGQKYKPFIYNYDLIKR